MKKTKIKMPSRLSWSCLSSFEYDKEQWYSKYILRAPQPESLAMKFGQHFAQSIEDGKPLVPLTVYPIVEHEMQTVFNKIPLIGYADTYRPRPNRNVNVIPAMREYKTGMKKWDQKRVDEHGQITMYLLMLYLIDKIPPQEVTCHLDWIPTRETGDFQIELVRPVKIHTFETKRTMIDILNFGSRIKRTWKEMEAYAKAHA